MSTNGMTDWAVDLANVTAVYPFQGWEFILYLAGLLFWLGWHARQLMQEADEIHRESVADPDGSLTRSAIERY